MTSKMALPAVSVPAFKPGHALPTTLAFVAGFVDACTFLAFSGLFVAQVTGSFVVAGSELVQGNAGFTLKVLAIPTFLLAGMATTFIVRTYGSEARQALVTALCIEAALLSALALYGVMGSPAGLLTMAALFGLSAMGVQSAAAHLLLPGYGSSNVMTTNTTQLSIDLADSLMRRRVAPGMADTGLVMLGFLVGVAVGGLAFKAVGLGCLVFAVAIVIGIAVVLGQATRHGEFPA